MRTLLPAVLALVFAACANASDIRKGMTGGEVAGILGPPEGTIELSERTLAFYPRGEVTYVDGNVFEFEIMTVDAFKAEQQRREVAYTERLERQAKLAERRIEEGTRMRAERLANPHFTTLPAADQLNYWRSFQQFYPEIDISSELAFLIDLNRREAETRRRDREVDALEARVAAAEREAAEARSEARYARDQSQRVRVSSYPVPYNYGYRRPTIIIHNGQVSRPPVCKPTPMPSISPNLNRLVNRNSKLVVNYPPAR